MKNVVIGILAHVDAGKTTLVESMLYNARIIKKMGRVDNKDTFLDYDYQERNRGITIYNKQVHFVYQNTNFMIIDTPGHNDFSCEMERALKVCDSVVVVVNGMEGIQNHQQQIFKLLEYYKIPAYIFVNKMDSSYLSKEYLLNDIRTKLANNCFEYCDYEDIALLDEKLMEEFLESGFLGKEISSAFNERKFYPLVFGSALKNDGVDVLMDLIVKYSGEKGYPSEFNAYVYKIGVSENKERLTYMKVLGGKLRAKQRLSAEEKVDQVRVYHGAKYELVNEVSAGQICVVTGIKNIEANSYVGKDIVVEENVLLPFLTYQMTILDKIDVLEVYGKIKSLNSELPEIKLSYNNELKVIMVSLMGEIQIEILKNIILNRFNVHVDFVDGAIIYKETIKEKVIGVGHYEPLKHYAEVHLLLEPLERNSGLVFETKLSQDVLALNWQRLILTHMKEKKHKGVLIGAEITDMKITLINGKDHLKHTEGGDFRQATYRAIRQGLMKAESKLLEPYYEYNIRVSKEYLSKVLFDLSQMKATTNILENENEFEVSGKVAVKMMQNYQRILLSYTKGKGKMSLQFAGYDTCHNALDIIEKKGYEPLLDVDNPAGSVFCEHGAGVYVEYDKVEPFMHLKDKG